ncbi:AH-BAR domain superfamily [Babesia duncani]|uniref:AH-BAR domain superfamily n=1 Tax=Babesia duncani TaxID=323732 RepID=A0AAD9PN95_9APIC|nr:AH-BAR domain superfamily [Babesia duncani]
MDLALLPESQQQLLHPLVKLKAEASLGTLANIGTVYADLADAYHTFATRLKTIAATGHEALRNASLGFSTTEASEALLLVRGNVEDPENVVQSVIAEQAGMLKAWESMLGLVDRMHASFEGVANTLNSSISQPLSFFSDEFFENVAHEKSKETIETFILNLENLRKSPQFAHSPSRRLMDNVLKAYKELQHCISLENDVNVLKNDKKVVKITNKTVKAKLHLSKSIQILMVAMPDIKKLARNLDSLDLDISKRSKQAQPEFVNPKQAYQFQEKFCEMEQRRLQLLSTCMQLMAECFAKSEREIYSKVQDFWSTVCCFSPSMDYKQFEALILGNRIQSDATHERALDPNVWLTPTLGPISQDFNDDQCPTPPIIEPQDPRFSSRISRIKLTPGDIEASQTIKAGAPFEKIYKTTDIQQAPKDGPKTGDFGEKESNPTFAKLERYLISLYNSCNQDPIDWLVHEIKGIEDLDQFKYYPFSIDAVAESGNSPHTIVFPYSLNGEIGSKGWDIIALETIILFRSYMATFLSHSAIASDNLDDAELREYLLANMGIVQQMVSKLRSLADAYRTSINLSVLDNEVLDIVLKARDTFENGGPLVPCHVMDVRYRILLLLDSFSKSDVQIYTFNGKESSTMLFDCAEFFEWIQRQLHLVWIALVQKLARVLAKMPNLSMNVESIWAKIIESDEPSKLLTVGFVFPSDPSLQSTCNALLDSLTSALGKVNMLKRLAVKESWGTQGNGPISKLLLEQVMDCMCKALELDCKLKCDEDDLVKGNTARPSKITQADCCTDMRIYNSSGISVLADLGETTSRLKSCLGACRPLRGKDGIVQSGRFSRFLLQNAYLKSGPESLKLCRTWAMEQCVNLRILDSLHGALTCFDISSSQVPLYMQLITIVGYFIEFGEALNFKLLKPLGPRTQIPLVAHSFLACTAYWYKEFGGSKTRTRSDMVQLIDKDNANVPYKNLSLKDLGFVPGVKAIDKSVNRVTLKMVKQMVALVQVPYNIQRLPQGLESVDCYLLFDLERLCQKIKRGNIKRYLLMIEEGLPQYSCLEYSNLELCLANASKSLDVAHMQIKGMQLHRVGAKIHEMMADIIQHHIPSGLDVRQVMLNAKPPRGLLESSEHEDAMGILLYLRLASARCRLDLIQTLSESGRRVEPEAVNWMIIYFILNHRGLYATLNSTRDQSLGILDIAGIWEFSTQNEPVKLYSVLKATIRAGIGKHFKSLCNKLNLAVCVASDEQPGTTGTTETTTIVTSVSCSKENLFPTLSKLIQACLEKAQKQIHGMHLQWDLVLPDYAIVVLQSYISYICPVMSWALTEDPQGIAQVMGALLEVMQFHRELEMARLVKNSHVGPNDSFFLTSAMFFIFTSNDGSDWYHTFNADFEALLKQKLVALLRKTLDFTEVIQRAIDSDNLSPAGGGAIQSSATIDVATVLQYTLRGTFEIGAPAPWLIQPFTSACENIVNGYAKEISKRYHKDLLDKIRAYITGSESGFEAFVQEHQNSVLHVDEDFETFLSRSITAGSSNLLAHHSSLVRETSAPLPTYGGVLANEDNLQDACDFTCGDSQHASPTREIVNHDEGDHALGPVVRRKWLKGGSSSNNHKNEGEVFHLLNSYNRAMEKCTVMQDLVVIWNFDFVSRQMVAFPDEILGFYYGQLRERYKNYRELHKDFGTSMSGDVDTIFSFEPWQLAEFTHSKKHANMIWAAQRLMFQDAETCIKDLLITVLWKLLLVEFRQDFFTNLYSPNVANGLTLVDISAKFPKTLFPFIQQLPQKVKTSAFEAMVSGIAMILSFTIKGMKRRGYHFTPADCKILAQDLHLLESYCNTARTPDTYTANLASIVAKVSQHDH